MQQFGLRDWTTLGSMISQKMIELKKQDDRRWECDYSNITSVCVHMNSDDDVTVRLEVE